MKMGNTTLVPLWFFFFFFLLQKTVSVTPLKPYAGRRFFSVRTASNSAPFPKKVTVTPPGAGIP
jgi:hypothetical protein